MRLETAVVVAGMLAAGCGSKCPASEGAQYPGASRPNAGGGVEVAERSESAALVTLDAEGRAWIDAQPVASDDELASRLGDRARGGSVVLSADGRVPHGRVVSVIDSLRAAGVTRVAFAVSANAASAPAGSTQSVAEALPAEPAPDKAPDSAPPTAPESAEPAGSLPQVIVENVGLHVGGGRNDDAEKAPFLRAIEPHRDSFRACFVKAEEPEKGGTFGVDLLIGRAGGKPEVRQPRTGMKGAEFRQCVIRAFEQITFDKPAKGPTMISYSIRYRLK
jgi:hypothetical protein